MLCYYFAYGSNNDPNRMMVRKAEFYKRELGILHDYTWVLNYQKEDGTAAANIEEQPGGYVYGTLYTGTENTLSALDVFEGVDYDCYRRKIVNIEISSGETVEATVYVANPEKCCDGLAVRRSYLDHCLKGRDLIPDSFTTFMEQFTNIVEVYSNVVYA